MDQLNFKDNSLHSENLIIFCRRRSSYDPKTIQVPYVVKNDGSKIYLAHNGCDDMDGSKDCEMCRGLIGDFIFRHPDRDLSKPFLPVSKEEETW